MRRTALVVTLLPFVAACGGGGDGPSAPVTPPPPSTTASLQVLTDTVRAGSMLVVNVIDGTVAGETATGSLGGRAVTFARSGVSALALLTPEMPAGSSTISVTIGAQTLQANVTILPALAIADPAAAIAAALDAQVNAVPRAAPSGFTAAAWNLQLAKLDSLIAESKAQVAGLSPADRLATARLLASFTGPANGASASVSGQPFNASVMTGLVSPQFWKLTACQSAMARVAGVGFPMLYSLGALLFFSHAPSPFLAAKAAAIVITGASFAGTLLVTLDRFAEAGIVCGVQKQVDVSSTNPVGTRVQRVNASVRGRVVTAGTQLFFEDRPIDFFPYGTFRRLSNVEIAQDVLVAKVATLFDGLHLRLASVYDRLPAAVTNRLPALPPRLSQTAPGAATIEDVPLSAVRIENVQPSTVQLRRTNGTETFSLALTTTVTDDVPFTYDVVSTYDPTIKTTRSGIARPYMSATLVGVPATITGTRTITTDGSGNQVGRLTCGGSATARVKGGDTAEWNDFAWTMSGPASLSGSDPIRGANASRIVFSFGDHPFSGSWYYAWTENGQPVFKPFTITIRIGYKDLLTGEVKAVAQSSFNCI